MRLRIETLRPSRIFGGANLLWATTMHNVANYINSHGGKAAVNKYISKRIEWNKSLLKYRQMEIFLNAVLSTIISLLMSVIVMVFLTGSAQDLNLNSIGYAFVMLTIQMFIPFIIYVATINWLIQKAKIPHSFPVGHFAFYLVSMIIIVVLFSAGDILISGYKRTASHYIKEFGLFMSFAILSAIFMYVLQRSPTPTSK
jgi:hypothetical protein